MEDRLDKVENETRERLDKLQKESIERGRALDERIDKLVSAIGAGRKGEEGIGMDSADMGSKRWEGVSA